MILLCLRLSVLKNKNAINMGAEIIFSLSFCLCLEKIAQKKALKGQKTEKEGFEPSRRVNDLLP